MNIERAFYKDLGQNLKRYRSLSGLNQEELAHKVGLTRTSITNIEKGTQKVSLFTLYAISSELKIHVNEVLPDFDRFLSEYIREIDNNNDEKLSEQIMRDLGIEV